MAATQKTVRIPVTDRCWTGKFVMRDVPRTDVYRELRGNLNISNHFRSEAANDFATMRRRFKSAVVAGVAAGTGVLGVIGALDWMDDHRAQHQHDADVVARATAVCHDRVMTGPAMTPLLKAQFAGIGASDQDVAVQVRQARAVYQKEMQSCLPDQQRKEVDIPSSVEVITTVSFFTAIGGALISAGFSLSGLLGPGLDGGMNQFRSFRLRRATRRAVNGLKTSKQTGTPASMAP